MSYIDDIAEIAYNYVVKRLDEELEMSKSCSGGALRYFSGETVENLIHIIWNELAEADIYKINSIKIEDLKGDKVPLAVRDSDGNSINESVDRHCFINGKLVAAIEKDVSRAISVFQCRVSGVIQLLISFFFFNDTAA